MSDRSLPLVTIVTPSFNQGAYLDEAMRSVLGQDYPRLEYLVVDGGSSDGSLEVIRRHEGRLAWWVSEADSGQAQAVNKGLARARGAIFAWLNSDDLLAPSAVRTAVRFLLARRADLVYGDRLHVDGRGNVLSVRRLPSHDPAMFARNFTIPQETAFFTREAWERAGGLDESLHFSMDFDLWCKMSRLGSMYHVPRFMGSYREHGGAKSVAFDRDEAGAAAFREEHRAVYERHFGRPLPGKMRMRWYRLARWARLRREMRGAEHRRAAAKAGELARRDLRGDTTVEELLA